MKIRKAILTGGGRATRLHPVTTTINKHLLPLANKPMIFHAIEKAVEAGVKEIFINLNPGETELQKYIGDGGHWNIKIEFYEQTGGPQGIAHVVHEARKFIGDEPFMFYLSDNVLLGSLTEMFEEFHGSAYDCMLALSEVKDPQRFGVPVFDSAGTLIDVLEKPQNPPNNFAVTGIYLYGPKIFFEAFDNIEKSPRGEYEISSIHSHFLKNGKKVGYKEITGWWKDTGQCEDLLLANKLLLDNLSKEAVPVQNILSADTLVEGTVRIGRGSQIKENVRLVGPVIIGENCVLQNCTVGPYVTMGQGTEVQQSTIENSIILDNATIHAPLKIIDSLIGKKAQIIERKNSDIVGHKMIVGDKTLVEM